MLGGPLPAWPLSTAGSWSSYDRSAERWTDTPHPSGLLSLADITERDHLVRQMKDIEAAGVTVTAWLATVPALSAIIDLLQAIEVDGVIVPDQFEQPRLADRLQSGDGPADMVERIAGLQLGGKLPEFLVIDETGGITVVANTVTSDSRGSGESR